MNEHAAGKPIKLFYIHMLLLNRSLKRLQTAKITDTEKHTQYIFVKVVDLVVGLLLLSHILPHLLCR